jgi:hypothetical protein
LVIFGSSVPAERAFVMTAVALGAILVDRPAISMRGLAAATAIVVALRKESVARGRLSDVVRRHRRAGGRCSKRGARKPSVCRHPAF